MVVDPTALIILRSKLTHGQKYWKHVYTWAKYNGVTFQRNLVFSLLTVYTIWNWNIKFGLIYIRILAISWQVYDKCILTSVTYACSIGPAWTTTIHLPVCIILDKKYNIAKNYYMDLRSFCPYNIFFVTDRSIYCHKCYTLCSFWFHLVRQPGIATYLIR
jgi:hypothetical protein